MKRMLIVLGAAVLFINTLVIPTALRADGGTVRPTVALSSASPSRVLLWHINRRPEHSARWTYENGTRVTCPLRAAA